MGAPAPLGQRSADGHPGNGPYGLHRPGAKAIVVERADPQIRLAVQVLGGFGHGPCGGIGGQQGARHQGNAERNTQDGERGSGRSGGQAPPGDGGQAHAMGGLGLRGRAEPGG